MDIIANILYKKNGTEDNLSPILHLINQALVIKKNALNDS